MLQEKRNGVNITATKREFLNMFQVFNETKDVKNVKYATINLVNSKVIREQLDELEAMATPSQEFIDLSIKAQQLIKEENEAGLKELEEENATLVEARKEQLATVQAKLDEEVTLELKMINEKILPEDLNAEQLEMISKLIN
jgi:hypothetical protein